MLILGLNIGHDPSAALVSSEGVVLAAAHEARLTRFKKERRFPRKAISSVLRAAGQQAPEIGTVVYSSYNPDSLTLMRDKYLSGIGDLRKSARQLLEEELYRVGLGQHQLIRVDHHFAHASAAKLACPTPDALIITSDGYGDGLSFSARRSLAGRVPERAEMTAPIDASLGLIYQYVTGGLGYSMLSEEWKVLGLEPFGDPSGAAKLFDQLLDGSSPIGRWKAEKLRPWCLSRDEWENVSIAERRSALRRYMELLVPQFDRRDVASAVQKLVERRLLSALEHLRSEPGTSLALAGGTFLNVKLNRVLSELEWVSDVSVFPAAGDGGNAVGAALAYLHQTGLEPPPQGITDVFWGQDYSHLVEESCDLAGLDGTPMGDSELIDQLASAVADGRIVAIARGRSEFGPRALLNRSLICRADRPDLALLLTEGLRRDPVMPYGCSMLSSEVSTALGSTSSLNQCLRFMVGAPVVTPEFGKRYSPVCHPLRGGGFSTRPHIVTWDDSWHSRLLQAVGVKTGGAVVLNTSFNLHGEPIVETPLDAIESFRRAAFPNSMLLLDNRIIPLEAVAQAHGSALRSTPALKSTEPPRRREACVSIVFGASSSRVSDFEDQISRLGLRIAVQQPISFDVAREVSRKFAGYAKDLNIDRNGVGRAFLVVGSESSSLMDRCAEGFRAGGSAIILTAASDMEASKQLREVFPDQLASNRYGSFADLLLWPEGKDIKTAVDLLSRTASLALAGFIYRLDDILGMSSVGLAEDTAIASVFGVSVNVKQPLDGRMYLYAPEGLAALKSLAEKLAPHIKAGDFLHCRQQGLILVYAPPAEGLQSVKSKVDTAMDWEIDGLVAVDPALSLEGAEVLEAVARRYELAVVGGSNCDVSERAVRPYGVRASSLGRLINRFPGLEV